MTYSKHKLFLYKEDFEKFHDGLRDSLEKIGELQGTDGFQSGEPNGPARNTEDQEGQRRRPLSKICELPAPHCGWGFRVDNSLVFQGSGRGYL